MKCLYYLSPNLVSTHEVSDDLHKAGISDWFIHIVSHDEEGLARAHLHASNYLETLDIVREAVIGTVLGFMGGVIIALVIKLIDPFPMQLPFLGYLAIVIFTTMFGCWVGGLDGWAHRNRKIERFMPDVEAGRYLILIYAKQRQLEVVFDVMASKHPEAKFVASDSRFLNPFSKLKVITGTSESIQTEEGSALS
jgi:hypothetical protein